MRMVENVKEAVAEGLKERRLEELKSQVDNLQLRIVELEERLRH